MRIKFPELRFPISYEKDNKPNYKVIELQAENEKLKDELIEALREQILDLKMQLERYTARVYTKEQYIPDPNEKDVGSHMIASTPRSRVRTMSEVAVLLEKRSLNAVSLKEEPGDKNDKV